MVRRGHGWSKRGTKASRKAHRESRKKKWYYVVANGRRDGIWHEWKNAKAQVHRYPGALHKKFDDLEEAKQWLRENRVRPPGVRTILFPYKDTPLPDEPSEYVTGFPSDPEPVAAAHIQVDNVITLQIPPIVHVAPIGTPDSSFVHVRRMVQRIAADQGNRTLDPPNFECPHESCGFSTGDLWNQRYLLLKRLYQLNAQLVETDCPVRFDTQTEVNATNVTNADNQHG